MNPRPASASLRLQSSVFALVGTLLSIVLSAAPGSAAVVGEGGQITLSGSIDQGVFETVTLQALYTEPVVVAFLQTGNDSQSAVARVRNVTATSFEVFLEQPDGGAHGAAETVSFLVVEAGRHVLLGGLEIEADSTPLTSVHQEGDAYVPSPVAFSAPFDTTPALLHSLVTRTNGAFMATAVSTVDATGFSAQLEAGGAGTSTTGETVGWIAVTDFGGLDCATDLQVGRGSDGSPDGVDDTAHIVDVTDHRTCVQQIGNADAAVASGNSTTDTDGYWARGGGFFGRDPSLFAEEDQVADAERSHADEIFAWVTFKSPVLLSTGAAVVFQFDSIASDINLEEQGFAIDTLRQMRYTSRLGTSRAVWDWNYVEIDAAISPSGETTFFSSLLANVAAIELRDGPAAEAAYGIGIDNLWTTTTMQFIFQLSPLLIAINLDPLSIDQQLFPYDEDGVAVSAAGGLLATTVNEPGGFLVADTQLTLADASTLAVGDRLRVDGEVLEVSSIDANGVDTTVVRASDGTTAAPHDDLRRVYDVEPRSDWFGSMITATTDAIDAVSTTLPVTLGGEFADGDVIRLFDETMVVSCPSAPCGNALTVTRGAQGTAATAHPQSTPVKRFMPVEQWTLDSLAEDAVQRGAGSLDYSLVVDVPQTVLITDLTFALDDAVSEFLAAGHLAVSGDIPVAFDQSIDVEFDTGSRVDRWTYTSRVWFDTEDGYDATVALFNDPIAFDPLALPLLLAGISIYSDLEIVHFTATCRPDASWANQDRQCITTVPTERDLGITITDGVTQAVPGESLTYTLTATNDGLPNSDVLVTDTFPAGLACTWTSVATGGATGNTAGSGSLDDTLEMPSLSSVTYTVTCAIDPAATGTLVNTATISSPDDDFDPDNDSATDDDTVLVPAADLSITKTDGVSRAVPGGSTTYTIVAANSSGPSAAADTLVTDTFPLTTTCSWTSIATGGAIGNSAGSGNLADVLTLPPGSTVTYTAICAIDPAATGTLSNTATISSAADSTPGDNAATDEDTVLVPTADLSITKTDGVSEVVAGGTTIYTIVAQNAGPSLATAMVSDSFPAITTCSWTSVATGGATGHGTGAGNLAETLTLLSGSSVTYTAVCAIDAAATGTLSNTATISSAADSTPGNNAATDEDIVLAAPGFEKAFSPSNVADGRPSTLTFTIDNTANTLAIGDLAFTDDLPLGLRIAPTPNPIVTCTGGELVARAKSSSISYSGGTVNAGATCSIAVDVFGSRPGSYLNTSSALASAAGTGAMATATLTVFQRPSFAKSFSPDPIFPGDTSTLTFTVDNSAGSAAVTDLVFTDALPAGLVIASPNGAVDGCAGTLDAAGGGTSIGYSGGLVGAGTTCTVAIDVFGGAAGTFVNQSSVLSSSAGFGAGNGPPSYDWAAGLNGNSVFGQAVTADSSDQVISVGRFSGMADFDPGPGTVSLSAEFQEPYVLKLDDDGAFVWVVAAAGAAGGTVGESSAVTVDADDNVLVAGRFRGEADFDPSVGTLLLNGGTADDNAFVWKLDSDGNLAWAVGLVEPLDARDLATGIATDGAGNVYVTGSFQGTSDFDPGPGIHNLSTAGRDAFVWKLDPDGNLIWVRSTNSVFGGFAEANGLSVDAAGNVYIAGSFLGAVDFDPSGATHSPPNAGLTDAFVWKLDADGNFVWAISAGGSDSDTGGGVTVDSVGMVSYSGTFQGTADFDPGAGVVEFTSSDIQDVFIAQLTATGAFSWAHSIDVNSSVVPGSITAGPSDNILVGLNFRHTVDFDLGPGEFQLEASSSLNVAVLKLDPAGGFLSAGRLGSGSDDSIILGFGSSVAVSGNGSVLATGTFDGIADFDPGVGTAHLTAGDNNDSGFVVRLGSSGAVDTLVVDSLTDLAISLSDNPDPVAAGANLTYTATVTNHGPSDSAGATVNVPLSNVAFSSSADCTETSATVTCAIGALDAGASRTVRFVVSLAPGQTADITNTATVTTSEADPESSNDSATASTAVDVEADLALEIDDSEDPIVGETFTYTLTVTNNGPSDASGGGVSDALPEGLAFESSIDGCSEASGTVSCVFGRVLAGHSLSLSFVVMLEPTFPASVTNTASVAGNELDPVPGNDTASEVTQLDTQPPTVSHLTTVSDTGDGELTDCETTAAQIAQFLMTFSEPVHDPPGDTEPDDVTNPDNYLLVSAGADRGFQTDQCGPAMGDDQAIEISTVTYDEVSTTATLTLGSMAMVSGLPTDLYRLLACGSTSILDLGGNALDGNGDGMGGDDFTRLFRVDSENRLANGHFDCDLDDWLVVSALPEELLHRADDLDDSADSGSAAIRSFAATTQFSLGQCVAISPLTVYDFGAGVRMITAASGITAQLTCSFYEAADCAGPEIGAPSMSMPLLGDTGSTWVDLSNALTSPARSMSTLCSVDFISVTGKPFEANVDQVRLVVDNEIFSDGFEGGDTSSWSKLVP